MSVAGRLCLVALFIAATGCSATPISIPHNDAGGGDKLDGPINKVADASGDSAVRVPDAVPSGNLDASDALSEAAIDGTGAEGLPDGGVEGGVDGGAEAGLEAGATEDGGGDAGSTDLVVGLDAIGSDGTTAD